MADRNPMLMNNNNPVPALGVVPGKFMLDHQTIEERKANAEDPMRSQQCYPGGMDDINHNAMPGDLAFGQRNIRDVEAMDGEPNELGTVSVAGEWWGMYNSHRDMEDNYYFLGVVTSEQRLENPLDRNTPDANNGSATGRVGTFSKVNNGSRTFYPGDYVMYKFPDTPKTPGNALGGTTYAHGGDPDHPGVNLRARYGESPSQFKPEIIPFDPSDLSIDLAGAFSSIMARGNTGIKDIPFSKMLCNLSPGGYDVSPHLCVQDEALSYKFGLLGAGLVFLETLVRNGLVTINPINPIAAQPIAPSASEAHAQVVELVEGLNIFETADAKDSPIASEALADMFMNNIGGGEFNLRQDAMRRFNDATGQAPYDVIAKNPQGAAQNYARLRACLLNVLTNGISGSIHSKRSKIIGRAMNAAAPGDTTHILFGHTI